MKKLSIGLALCCLTLHVSLSIVHAECKPNERAMQFQKALQEAAQKDPAKISAIQADVQSLAKEMPDLISQGKQEEICVRYDEMEAKLQ